MPWRSLRNVEHESVSGLAAGLPNGDDS